MCFRQAQCTPSSELRNVIANYMYVNSTIKLYCMRVMHKILFPSAFCYYAELIQLQKALPIPHTGQYNIIHLCTCTCISTIDTLQIKDTASNVSWKTPGPLSPGRLPDHSSVLWGAVCAKIDGKTTTTRTCLPFLCNVYTKSCIVFTKYVSIFSKSEEYLLNNSLYLPYHPSYLLNASLYLVNLA